MCAAETPKRVLHVVSAMNRGGTETLLMNLYRNIDHSKVQFDFVSHRKERCDYDEEIESLGGKICKIDSLGQQGPVSYVREIKKIIKKHPYLAVHSHTDFQCGFPALAAKLAGIQRIVCHSHSNQWGDGKGLKDKMLLKVLQGVIRYSATDYCACSVEAARFLFGKKMVTTGKIRVLNNGIDVSDYLQRTKEEDLSVREEWQIPEEARIIGHVGNFSYVKNQIFILTLLKRLLEEGLNIVVVLAGDGSSRRWVEEKTKQMGVFDKVRFLGVRKDIPRLMKAFDVFLFPSIYEGFGIAALEAQCAGTPCVVSDAVPKSTDMGLDLMSYVSLDEDLDQWSQEVKKAMSHERPDDSTIDHHFVRSGFNIRESVPKWLALYGIS